MDKLKPKSTPTPTKTTKKAKSSPKRPSPPAPTGKIRIQKWLSQMGVLSRRQTESYLIDGRIKVNGKVVTELGFTINPDNDSVAVDGKQVIDKAPPRVYWMLNKPDR